MDFGHGTTVNVSQVIDRPALPFETIAFNGEIVEADTGDESQFYGISRSSVISLIQAMEPGDSLVINAATH